MAQTRSRDGDKKLGKVFCDSIHGHVELHPLLVKIIDTPQFQRLRNIKQLGGGYLVYPGASHNRFEHSIGVAHLAGVLAKTLQENQLGLKITDEDILCVQIGGLCHDLGHGPFSHLFDEMFIRRACKNKKWKHELVSVQMFENLVEKNELWPEMESEGKLKEDDLTFIKELILGEPLNGTTAENEGWPYKGRNEDKSFLYEIVSNKQNGIDVDKFDYFARDCHHLGIKNNFDHMRYLKFARVIEVETDKRKHICLRDKEVWNLYDLFHTRLLLHRQVCHHKVTTNVQIMITDALFSAKDYIKIEGADGTSAENINMEAYTMLTDQITERILESTEPKMKKAKTILQRIMTRKLYQFLGEAKVIQQNKKIPKERFESLREELAHDLTEKDFDNINSGTLEVVVRPTQGRKIPKEKVKSLKEQLKEAANIKEGQNYRDYFQVERITFSYGKDEEDPIKYTYFYKKNQPDKGFPIPRNKVSDFLPEHFLEQRIRVYWKKEKDETLMDTVAQAFKEWCNTNGFEVDIYNDGDNKRRQPAEEEADPSTSKRQKF